MGAVEGLDLGFGFSIALIPDVGLAVTRGSSVDRRFPAGGGVVAIERGAWRLGVKAGNSSRALLLLFS